MLTLQATRPESYNFTSGGFAADEVADFYHYEDTGCEASDSCLDCPLPLCKYDDPVWYHRNRRLARDFRMMHVMQRECLSFEETAERFSVTVRTVFRVLQRCREASMQGSPVGEKMLSVA